MAEDKRDQESLADELGAQGQDPLSDAAAGGDVDGSEMNASESELSVDAQLELLQEELGKARDQALRAQADAQNAQRRAEQDVEKARKFALERFCGELLPVVDNLERALEAINGDDPALASITEGVDLTLKSFVGALSKFQIEQLDPVGEPFDPQHHQAMSMIENPDAEPNTVLAVMQKGYTLNGRLVRPAMVMVSKAPQAG
ncbi:nucleotide exchange factor GrpE [bacterium]|nr:nucleotide exchange factor GrpE [bacterium]